MQAEFRTPTHPGRETLQEDTQLRNKSPPPLTDAASATTARPRVKLSSGGSSSTRLVPSKLKPPRKELFLPRPKVAIARRDALKAQQHAQRILQLEEENKRAKERDAEARRMRAEVIAQKKKISDQIEHEKLRRVLEEKERRRVEAAERFPAKKGPLWGEYESIQDKVSVQTAKIVQDIKYVDKVEQVLARDQRRLDAQKRKELLTQTSAMEREEELRKEAARLAAIKAKRELEEAEAQKKREDAVREANYKQSLEARLAAEQKTTPVKEQIHRRIETEESIKERRDRRDKEAKNRVLSYASMTELRQKRAADRVAREDRKQRQLAQEKREQEQRRAAEAKRAKDEQEAEEIRTGWEIQKENILKQEQEKLLLLLEGEKRVAPSWGVHKSPPRPPKPESLRSVMKLAEREEEALKAKQEMEEQLLKVQQRYETEKALQQRREQREAEQRKKLEDAAALTDLRRRQALLRKQAKEANLSLDKRLEAEEENVKVNRVRARRERQEKEAQKRREQELAEANYRRSFRHRLETIKNMIPQKDQLTKRAETEQTIMARKAQQDAEEKRRVAERVRKAELRQKLADSRVGKQQIEMKRLAEQHGKEERERLVARKRAQKEEKEARIGRQEWEKQRELLLQDQERLRSMAAEKTRPAPAWGGAEPSVPKQAVSMEALIKLQKAVINEEKRQEALRRKELATERELLERQEQARREELRLQSVKERQEREEWAREKRREADLLEANYRRSLQARLAAERKTPAVLEKMTQREEHERRFLQRKARNEEQERRNLAAAVAKTEARHKQAMERLAQQEAIQKEQANMHVQAEKAAVLAKKRAEKAEEDALAQFHREELRMSAKLHAWTSKRMRSFKNMSSSFLVPRSSSVSHPQQNLVSSASEPQMLGA
eukprot:gb/GEZN01001413.1/.p1 GENE.gb/GEZN01001413.1/~~gb/GEZN01001413.1/.p1  ORF type:complete len:898 (+),score=263.79 gb/GEZN01001413.1/:75-2768(+)